MKKKGSTHTFDDSLCEQIGTRGDADELRRQAWLRACGDSGNSGYSRNSGNSGNSGYSGNSGGGQSGSAVSRKLKYGSLSAAFAAVVVLLCIGLNLLMSGFSAKWDLRVDITDTKARFFTISDATRDILAKHFKDEPDWKIKIRFLAPEDKLTDTMIPELARSYVSEFGGHVELHFDDIYADPVFAGEYERLTQTRLSPEHVIIEGRYHTRAYGFPAFYYFSKDPQTMERKKVSFTGEKTFTAAILRTGLAASPKAVFTTGHGESVDGIELGVFNGKSPAEIERAAHEVPLFNSLYDMGFEVEAVDLNCESLPEMTRLVIVCDPKQDFTSFDPQNPEEDGEIDLLRKYMNKYATSLIVAVNDETGELPTLMEYLEQEYGIGYVPKARVTDNDRSLKGSGGRTIFGSLPKSLPHSVDEKILRGLSGRERLAFGNAVRLTVSDESHSHGEGVLVNSSPKAVSEGKTGVYPLFAFNADALPIEKPEGHGSSENKLYRTAFLIGSTDFLSSKGLVSRYANRDLLESVFRVANTVEEYAAVKEVDFVSEALDITTGQARGWTIVVTFVAPLAVLAIAAAVWAARRNS